MERITQKTLQAVVDRINRTAGTPFTPYRKSGEKFVAEIGNYHLDYAYGGVKLVQMSNESGGIRTITTGFVPKRELYNQLHAFLNGLEAGKGAV